MSTSHPIYTRLLEEKRQHPERTRFDIDLVDVAKLMRHRLATLFPGVTFSVRTSRFAGGSDIRVQWTDGPRARKVEEVVHPFHSRGFDGSIDMEYHYSHWLLPDGSVAVAYGQGTRGSLGTVPEIITDAPVPEALYVDLHSGYIFASRNLSNEEARIEEAKQYIRGHCNTQGSGSTERFGNDYVEHIAWGMLSTMDQGEPLEAGFRRAVLREEDA